MFWENVIYVQVLPEKQEMQQKRVLVGTSMTSIWHVALSLLQLQLLALRHSHLKFRKSCKMWKWPLKIKQPSLSPAPQLFPKLSVLFLSETLHVLLVEANGPLQVQPRVSASSSLVWFNISQCLIHIHQLSDVTRVHHRDAGAAQSV